MPSPLETDAPPTLVCVNGSIGVSEVMRAARVLETEALVAMLKRISEDVVEMARHGLMSTEVAQHLTSGTLLDECQAMEPMLDSALAHRRHVLDGLRFVYTSRVSWALFTVEWMDGLTRVLNAMGAQRVLEVCCGLNVLAGPMVKRGVQWTATERAPPNGREVSAPEVCGALEALSRHRLGSDDGPDVVFFSWWSGEETDEDFLVVAECLENGVPVIFVGEGAGGCTGSSMLWTSGLPIGRMYDTARQLGVAFVDVPCWDHCSDCTWVVDPKLVVAPAKRSAPAREHVGEQGASAAT